MYASHNSQVPPKNGVHILLILCRLKRIVCDANTNVKRSMED